MGDYEEAITRLGRDEVTATFGVGRGTDWEIVGPMKPNEVYYGLSYGYDESDNQFRTEYTVPLIHLNFNKYRSDLPPWNDVEEFVLASRWSGDVVEYTFAESYFRGAIVTDDLKTISLGADGPISGVDGMIIERDRVADDHSTDTSSFKVTEELV